MKLLNPFTPSKIAADPRDFFGRQHELDDIERRFGTSSVAIQGAMGIGKSSLIAQTRKRMEGFGNNRRSKSILCVCNIEISSVDELARMILEKVITIDETSREVTLKLPVVKVVERKDIEVTRNFVDGRHLAALNRILSRDYIDDFVSVDDLFIIAIDEADKNAKGIAHLVRTVLTETQGNEINNIRFLLCGVEPFFNEMADADPGILRFIPSPLTLQPFSEEETHSLLVAKFGPVIENAEASGKRINIQPGITDYIYQLSGGRPDLIQLIGSHLIDCENDDSDGLIDARDLTAVLKRICLMDRREYYNDMFHRLELAGMVEPFFTLLSRMSERFPTVIELEKAWKYVSTPEIKWLVDNKFIGYDEYKYFLKDELLKVRLTIDNEDRIKSPEEFRAYLDDLRAANMLRPDENEDEDA